jgi:glycosyltransferase involved in cell wall biosynthesis
MVIDTSPQNRVKAALQLIPRLIWCDVASLHVSTNGLLKMSFPIILLCSILRRPLVLRLFGGDLDLAQRSLWKRIVLSLVLPNVKLLLVETKMLRLWVLEHYPGVRTEHYGNSRTRVQPKRTVAPKTKKVLYLGRITEQKGLYLVAEALRQPECQGISLDIFGSPDEPNLAETLSNHPQVTLQGMVENKKIPNLIQQYDVVVLPTRYVGEGYPGVVLECFVAGRPIVVSRPVASAGIRALDEIVKHGENAIIVDGVQSMAQALQELCNDPDLCDYLGENAWNSFPPFCNTVRTKEFTVHCATSAVEGKKRLPKAAFRAFSSARKPN